MKLYNAGVHKWDGFQKALDVLQTIPPRSSCHRRTIFGVVESCSTLKTRGAPENQAVHNVSDRVEHAEVVYAIKLTICELESTNISPPLACHVFHPLEGPKQNTGAFGYFFSSRRRTTPASAANMWEEISPALVMSCKNALYNTDFNGWTTYTSSLGRVHQLCQASRDSADMGKCVSVSSFSGTEVAK